MSLQKVSYLNWFWTQVTQSQLLHVPGSKLICFVHHDVSTLTELGTSSTTTDGVIYSKQRKQNEGSFFLFALFNRKKTETMGFIYQIYKGKQKHRTLFAKLTETKSSVEPTWINRNKEIFLPNKPNKQLNSLEALVQTAGGIMDPHKMYFENIWFKEK